MTCQIETVTYPAWWDTATTIRVHLDGTQDSANHTHDRVDMELLPEGVSAPGVLYPWSYIVRITLVS